MSATIDKESFCENTGFNPSTVEIVDTEVSPFPIENRKVEFADVKRLSYSSTRDDEEQVIKKIDEIMTKYSDKKGLVLTSSKSRCFEILQNLSEENKKRVRICHSFNSDGKTQDQVVQEHAESENGG